MSTIVLEQKPIQLRYNDESNVVVHPENEDRMVISSAEAVLAILGWGEVTTQLSILRNQIQELLIRIGKWCSARSDQIHRADIQVRGNYTRLELIVMQKSVSCDDGLMEELAEFDFDLFNDPNLNTVRLDTLVIPRCSFDSMQAFVNLKRSLCVVKFSDV